MATGRLPQRAKTFFGPVLMHSIVGDPFSSQYHGLHIEWKTFFNTARARHSLQTFEPTSGSHYVVADIPAFFEEAVQSKLVYKGRFVPSADLVRVWVEGLNEFRREVEQPLIDVDKAAADGSAFQDDLARTVDKVVDNFATRKAYECPRYKITFGQKFLPSFAALLTDHLTLSASCTTECISILLKLFYEQSKIEPVFYGRWGKLIIDEAQELTLDLHKPRADNLDAMFV